jgi:translation initiation factor IF-2
MSDKVTVAEVAQEAGASSQEIIVKAANLGIELKNVKSTVTFDQAEEIVNYLVTGKIKDQKKPTLVKKEVKVVKKNNNEVTTKKAEEPKQTKIVEDDKPATITEERIEVKEEPKQTPKTLETTKTETKTMETVIEIKKPLSQGLRKTGGLKIIKKNKPASSRKKIISGDLNQPISTKTARKSLSELLGNGPSLDAVHTRVKKDRRKSAARSQDHGTKLNVNTTSDFTQSQDNLGGEEVVLFDMANIETSKFLQEPPKKKPDQIRTTRPSAFGNRPRGLKRGKKKKKYIKVVEIEDITEVTIPEECRVYEFAEKIGKSAGDVIGKLFMLGMMVTKNDFLGADELEILGEEYGIDITIKDELEELNYEQEYHEEKVDKSNFVTRPPVVTIMGHVDHGKTSLLDKIRSSRVAAGEAGGITQHIGAYTVAKNGQEITFVDTPGHEAFSAMRRRGASITDIIIIVVAADDGVKPQTIESIKAAKQSGAPIIVAVNKIDKESANIDMVKAGMAEHDITPADWGGDVEFIPVSAHTGKGIDELLENILIQAELLELEADPKALAKATVIESQQVKGRGAVATIIVQNGTLKVGDNIVADTTFGRVKAILDGNGKSVKELTLSHTGQVVGLNEVPPTGSTLVAMDSAAEAKEIATKRAEYARAKELSRSTKVSLDEMAGLIAEGKIKALPVILKADAGGSLEAIKASLESIKNDEVKVKIISSGVGGITEADVAMASASDDCIILGFNVRPTGSVKTKAKSESIEIKTYSIIYDLLDDIKSTLSGMMSTIVVEENTGQANVLETFVVPKVGTVAGCKVTDGKVVRGGLARIIRDGVVVYTGAIKSLKRFKDDVKEVSNGYECGVIFENYNDIRVNDYIETFIEHKEEQTID